MALSEPLLLIWERSLVVVNVTVTRAGAPLTPACRVTLRRAVRAQPAQAGFAGAHRHPQPGAEAPGITGKRDGATTTLTPALRATPLPIRGEKEERC